MDIENLIVAIRSSQVRIADHADEEADDALTFGEIYFSVRHGEIIEEYPSDKPYPSSLSDLSDRSEPSERARTDMGLYPAGAVDQSQVRQAASCLGMGKNFTGESIHGVWAYNSVNEWAVLITVYRPDPARLTGK